MAAKKTGGGRSPKGNSGAYSGLRDRKPASRAGQGKYGKSGAPYYAKDAREQSKPHGYGDSIGQYRSDKLRGGYNQKERFSKGPEEIGRYKPFNAKPGGDETRPGGFGGYDIQSGKGGRVRSKGGEPYRKSLAANDARQKPDERRGGTSKSFAKAQTGVDEAEQRAPYIKDDELPFLIMGRNAVREAIKSGRSIDRILVIPDQDGSLREVVGLARDNNLIIRETNKSKLDELCMPFGHGGKTGNHQGIVAMIPGVEYCDLSDILDVAKQRGEHPFVIMLDGIEDPQNLGSIIRSAECAGAHGVVIPKRRSASVTAAVAKASAGAVEYMKVARVSNLSGAIERLKDAGLWIIGADMGGTPMSSIDFSGALALVIGSEGSGLSKLVKEKCDFLVRIPVFGKIDSLNASVAAAVLMYAKRGFGV